VIDFYLVTPALHVDNNVHMGIILSIPELRSSSMNTHLLYLKSCFVKLAGSLYKFLKKVYQTQLRSGIIDYAAQIASSQLLLIVAPHI